ncbi:MAG: LLM class flavin-dependent oxidoreductase [Pseudomonadota bacterium]|nr:LLM class flavin-dependent oxidoreductase [Pseudomonadota bacterium]
MRYSIFSVQDHYPQRERDQQTLYAQILRQCELADALGYDTFFVAEHHFHEYGVVPNPAVMLAAMAQRTSRIRLGSAISILTFHHPLTVAESYAMVDLLSGGRLVMGVGSGYLKHEFAGYRVDPAEKRERFDEHLEVFTRALAGERVTFKGRFIEVEDVQINVLPLQRPSPPVYVAILRREAAYYVGRAGRKIIFVPYASVERFEEIGDLVADYRRGQAEAGVAPTDEDILLALHTHVAESDPAARRDAAAPFDLYVATRLYAKRQTYDDVMRSELSLMGSVETVADKLMSLQGMGVRHVLTLQNFGLMSQETVESSMTRLMERVAPKVAQQAGTREAA